MLAVRQAQSLFRPALLTCASANRPRPPSSSSTTPRLHGRDVHSTSNSAILRHLRTSYLPECNSPVVRRRSFTSSARRFEAAQQPQIPQPLRRFLARDSTQRQLRELRLELEGLRQHIPPHSRTRSLIISLLVLISTIFASYQFSGDFRRFVLATERCTRVGWAVVRCIVDYKLLFRKTWDDTPEGKARRHQDYEDTHLGCAIRLREVLKKNGGIYIKLGQHLSSVQLIPTAWQESMKPLQDQCFPTPLPELQALFLEELGAPLSTFFSTFDPIPIGVASLAQVHIATDRQTGRKVAVKIMHPDLEEFCHVDMKTTTFMLKFVKSIFPSFEFTWLGEEMEQNLPLEMDFRHETANAARAVADFADVRKTSLVIPEVLWAKRRAMVMEFIEGGRVDNMRYLAEHNIDRNRVAQELSRIFSKMIYIDGYFHADPHAGNLLIRPRQERSRSPYNFEIVLLDHGLYFDMAEQLRVAYAHLWLSLITPSSPSVELERRKWAYEAGNIDDELYPIFQAAITGRRALDGSGKSSMLNLGEHTKEEARAMRHAVVEGGLIESLFDLLRRVPRRILMVLKVNDLTRSLDASLHTTHGPTRVFLIVAHYCNLAVYQDDKQQFSREWRTEGASFSLLGRWTSSWVRYRTWRISIGALEAWADFGAGWEKWRLWMRGMRRGGLRGAFEASTAIELVDG